MEMRVQIERGAETVNEGHRAGTCVRFRVRALRAQMTLDLVEENTQGAIEGLSVTLEVVAQPLGQGQDPLAHRQRGQYMIDEVSGGLGCLRRVLHEGQTARPLQEKATRKS